MGRVTRLWFLLPRRVRLFPPDLAAVVGLVVATGLVASLPGVRDSALRAFVGAPFVLLLPGYALTAALFPRSGAEDAHDAAEENGRDDTADAIGERDSTAATSARDPSTDAGFLPEPREGITLLERVLFSVGLSVVVVPLFGLALNFTPWGIRFGSLALAIGGFTVGTALFAAIRRWEVPPDERFRVPYDEWLEEVRTELFESNSRLETALNVVIVLSTLVALGSGAYAVLGPQEDQSFTQFYVLGENESGGLVADDYPTTFGEDENETLVVGISNHEHRTTEYTVVVRLREVEARNGSPTVVDSQRVDRFRVEVPANETVHRRHGVTPELTGEGLQLQYLLYVGDPPANPTGEDAYRNVHVWVNVTASDAGDRSPVAPAGA